MEEGYGVLGRTAALVGHGAQICLMYRDASENVDSVGSGQRQRWQIHVRWGVRTASEAVMDGVAGFDVVPRVGCCIARRQRCVDGGRLASRCPNLNSGGGRRWIAPAQMEKAPAAGVLCGVGAKNDK